MLDLTRSEEIRPHFGQNPVRFRSTPTKPKSTDTDPKPIRLEPTDPKLWPGRFRVKLFSHPMKSGRVRVGHKPDPLTALGEREREREREREMVAWGEETGQDQRQLSEIQLSEIDYWTILMVERSKAR